MPVGLQLLQFHYCNNLAQETLQITLLLLRIAPAGADKSFAANLGRKTAATPPSVLLLTVGNPDSSRAGHLGVCGSAVLLKKLLVGQSHY